MIEKARFGGQVVRSDGNNNLVIQFLFIRLSGFNLMDLPHQNYAKLGKLAKTVKLQQESIF